MYHLEQLYLFRMPLFDSDYIPGIIQEYEDWLDCKHAGFGAIVFERE